MKLFIYSLSVFISFLSCHCHHDKLKVINKTNNIICYETALYDPVEQRFYEGPAGDSIPIGGAESPVVRWSVQSAIQREEYNQRIYIYFFPCNMRRDFWSNTDSFVRNIDTAKIKSFEFTEYQLDSMDWKILFKDKF